jgi:glycosyltransferase involved in cell wall biosynthesis
VDGRLQPAIHRSLDLYNIKFFSMDKNYAATDQKDISRSAFSMVDDLSSGLKKTKVLIVVDGIRRGGMERRMLELLKGLKRRETHEVEVLVLSKKIGYREIFSLGFPIHLYERKIKKDPKAFLEVYKICKSFRPDLLHSWGIMSAIYSIPATQVLGIPFINGSIRDATKRKGGLNSDLWRARLSFLFSDVIVGNSQAGLRAFKAPVKKSVCIRNGIDLKRAHPNKTEEEVRREYQITTPRVVGMVGGFNYRKDYDSYLAAAQKIVDKREDVTFVTIGKGANFERTQAALPDRYKDRIRLLGLLRDVESAVNIFDVGVLATNARNHEEGISNAILEYMLLGKPVVATDGGGTPEVVIHEKTGFLVPPLSPAHLAEKIEFLLDHPAKSKEMGQAGRQRIHDHFSLPIMEEHYVQLYSSLCDKIK